MPVRTGSRRRGRLRWRQVRTASLDVVLITAFVLLADVVLLTHEAPVSIRAVFALPLLFFLPGYAVVTALFPRRPEPNRTAVVSSGESAARRPVERRSQWSTDGGDDRTSPPSMAGVAGAERLVLGLGLSLAVLPLVALGLSLAGAGLSLGASVPVLSAFVIGSVSVGAVRRRAVPEPERFGVGLQRGAHAYRRWTARSSGRGRTVTAVLALSGLIAVGALSYALVVPATGPGYTELSLLTRTADGNLVAGGYPSTLTAGEPFEVVAGIHNQEGRTTTYTLVTQLQRVRVDGGAVTVVESQPSDQQQLTVRPGERATTSLAVTPELTGTDLRLVVLLYRGTPPAQPTVENAYRSDYLWFDVPAASAGPGTGTGSG